MDKLPDYLIENYIIPFLTSEELFYKFRPLSSYYYHCARVKILTKFPQEIMKSLKKILEFNTRKDPTSSFQEFAQKLLVQKRLILILTIQANPSVQINQILINLRDERALRLIAFFYVLVKDEAMQNLIRQEKYDEIQEKSISNENIEGINDKIKDALNKDDEDFDINEYKIVYSSLDDEFLRNNEFTVHLFNFVTLFVDLCETKIGLNAAKNKLMIFMEQISQTSEIWPKKKVFYEKTIELVADTQILAKDAKNMLKLFKKYEIETDLDDFNYNKEAITENDIKSNDGFEKIKLNRKKLNATILRLHQLLSFFIKSIYLEKENKNILYIDIFEIQKFKVGGYIFLIEEFLFILSMIKVKFCVNETTFVLTRNYLFHNIYHQIYNINPSVTVIEEIKDDDKNKEEESDKSENINGIKYISALNEDIGDGMNNFESVLENTENAGKEINESFIQLTQNLEKYSNRLQEQIDNNNNN